MKNLDPLSHGQRRRPQLEPHYYHIYTNAAAAAVVKSTGKRLKGSGRTLVRSECIIGPASEYIVFFINMYKSINRHLKCLWLE